MKWCDLLHLGLMVLKWDLSSSVNWKWNVFTDKWGWEWEMCWDKWYFTLVHHYRLMYICDFIALPTSFSPPINQVSTNHCTKNPYAACVICQWKDDVFRVDCDYVTHQGLSVKCWTKVKYALSAQVGLVWLVCSIFPLSLKNKQT